MLPHHDDDDDDGFYRWSKVYFVSWWLTSSVMWVNLFVALILEVRSSQMLLLFLASL